MLGLQRPPRLFRSLALILLSVLSFPLGVYLLLSSYVLQVLLPFSRFRRRRVFAPRRVLISGVNNSVGLALARNLYLQGHYVIGADFEKYRLRGIGRYSRAIRRFYSLPNLSEELGAANYIYGLLEIVKDEKINIHISCTSTTTPVEDAIAKSVIEKITKCKCIAFDAETAKQLSSKPDFLDLAKSIGLDVPEVHNVTSRDQIHKLLGPTKRKERSFILTKVDSGEAKAGVSRKDLLPRRSLSQTYQYVSQVSVSNNEPYLLEEHFFGEEYCSYVLMIAGFVEAFVVCLEPRGNHVKGLEADTFLYHTMYRLTKRFTEQLPTNYSGPLTIHFREQMIHTTAGFEKKLVPRACTPKIGLPSLLLLPSARMTTPSPFSAEGTRIIGSQPDALVTYQGRQNIYWMGSDVLNLLLLPVVDVLLWRISLFQVWRCWRMFVEHLLFWREATFVIWDPLPSFWQYCIFWPLRLTLALVHGEKWNVLDLPMNELRYDALES